MQIEELGVIGAGTMGAGIAQVAAQHGYRVTLVDVSRDQLRRALTSISGSLERRVAKGQLAEAHKSEALGRLVTTVEMDAVGPADLVIEAVPEQIELKRSTFRHLDAVCEAKTLLASNTSSLSISLIAAATKRPAQVVGMHFFNPVTAMQLVEIVKGLATADETIEAVTDLAKRLGKIPITINDSPGFAVNRVLVPMINEAVFALMEGVTSAQDIDQAIKLGMNLPMGPLELADLIGLDVCLAVMESLYADFADSKYRPCPLLRKMVAANRLGRKNGVGFYEYR